mmetsp:Transcript_64252/g.184665  ORF Transcript_64252/g.184665 Transcript_64252/m.184665 type:complete len:327 (-) Transcript_64252:365-1345(-)
MMQEPTAQAAYVDEAAACEDYDMEELAYVLVGMQNGLRCDENNQRKQEPHLPGEKLADGDTAPDEVHHHDRDRVNHEPGIPGVDEVPNRRSEPALAVDNQVPDIVIHTALAMLCGTGAPDQAVQQHRNQVRRIHAQTLHDIGMSLEECVHAVVVAIAVGADRQQVLNDGSGRNKAPRLNRPKHGRDRLGADTDAERDLSAQRTWSARHCLPQHLRRVGIDRPHHNGRALADDTGKNARNQSHPPSEGLKRVFVVDQRTDHLYASCNKGAEQFRRDAIAHMTQSKGRDVLDRLAWLTEYVIGHRDHLVGNEMKPSRRLLEIVLPRGR